MSVPSKSIDKNNEQQIKEDIIQIISDRGENAERTIFDAIEAGLHPRFNYIILPVWQLDELIADFQKLIGK